MAHFAKIVNGKVVEVLVVDNEHESYGEKYLNDLGLDGKWVQTSYNSNFGKKFATPGDDYLEGSQSFKSPSPYASWTFNEEKWEWEAPVSRPTGPEVYNWDEASQSWI